MSSSFLEKLGLPRPGSAITEKSAKRIPTLRLELNLEKPTDKTFPEFSYAQLAKNALGQKNADDAPVLPFGEDGVEDSALVALAKAMEEKYGPKGARKRKRLEHERDLIDVGAGYDENDPFVDNSDAVDDYVPMEYEAEWGGFYINKGDLMFRQVNSSDDEQPRNSTGGESGDDFQAPSKKHPKIIKRIKIPGEKGKKDGTRGRKPSTGKPLKDPSGVLPTQDRPRKHSMQKPKLLMKTPTSASDTPAASADSGTSTVGQTTVGLGAISTPAEEDRQPVAGVDTSIATPNIKSEPPLTLENSVSQVSGMMDSNMDEGSPLGMDGDDQGQVTELPTGLPDDLVRCVQKFEQEVARGAFTPHTSKHLDSTYDDRLLEVEMKLRGVKGKARVAVFAYLSSFLQHSKDSLQRRAKKLNIAAEEAMLEEPLQRLKEVVEAVLPEQITKFKEEVRRAVEAHSQSNPSSSTEEKTTLMENALSGDADEDAEPSMLESPVSESKGLVENADVKPKKFRAPRPKFAWSDETRRLLHAVVLAKVKGIKATMLRIVGAEESIRAFLEQRVKPLWPANWMTVSILYRESKPVHLQITNPQQFKSTQALQQRRQASGVAKRPYHRTAPLKTATADGSLPKTTSAPAGQTTLLELTDTEQSEGQENTSAKSSPTKDLVKNDNPEKPVQNKDISKVLKISLQKKSLLTKAGQLSSSKTSNTGLLVSTVASSPSSTVTKNPDGLPVSKTTIATTPTSNAGRKVFSLAGNTSGNRVTGASPDGSRTSDISANSGSSVSVETTTLSPVGHTIRPHLPRESPTKVLSSGSSKPSSASMPASTVARVNSPHKTTLPSFSTVASKAALPRPPAGLRHQTPQRQQSPGVQTKLLTALQGQPRMVQSQSRISHLFQPPVHPSAGVIDNRLQQHVPQQQQQIFICQQNASNVQSPSRLHHSQVRMPFNPDTWPA